MTPVFKSPLTRKILIALGVLVLALLIFEAGDYEGFRRGQFSSRWRDMYMLGMNDPHSMFAPFDRGNMDEPRQHGVAGTVISVNMPDVVVKGPHSPEEIIMMATSTSFRWIHGEASSTDLKAGDNIIVIGSPDDSGHIRASFVRIIPARTQ